MSRTKILSFLLIVLFSDSIFADGTLLGVVTDSLTNKPLVGANVYLLETALGSSTDLDGAYRIEGVPEGDYTLQVAYLGYLLKNIPVTVESGKKMVVNAGLVYDIIEGKEVLITAQAEGQVAAINQQINSNTIINVVSEERIQELPDANAAEAVGRLPGVALQRSGGEANKIVLRGFSPQYSSITLDGVRIATTGADDRDVDLSTISQRSLAGIELYKALTSDQDGDAIAGGLNFVTRKAPLERLLRLDVRGSYSGIENSYDQYDGTFRYGERFFNNKFGVQISGNLEQRIRSQENIDLEYNIDDFSSWVREDFQLNYVDETRKRSGVGAIFDFDTPDGGSIKFSNIYSYTKRDFIEYSRNYPISLSESPEVYYSARDREENIAIFNSFIKGDNHLWGWGTEWNVSYARSKSDFPFDYEMNFREPSTTDAQGNITSGMRNPPESVLQGPPEEIIPYAVNAFDKAYLYSAFYRTQDAEEEEFSTFLNLSKDYSIGTSYSGTLKFGGKYRNKARSRSRTELFGPYYNFDFRRYVRMPDGRIVHKDEIFTGTRFENLQRVGNPGVNGTGPLLFTNFLDIDPQSRDIFNEYALYPLINRDALQLWWDLNQNGVLEQGNGPEYNKNLEPDATFYDITERVSAAYIMNTFNFGRDITFILGVRMENENNDYSSRYSPVDLDGYPVPTGAIRDTSAVHNETNWLPNAHLTYRPTDFMGIRLAAYKALARPDFNDRLENFVARKQGTFYTGNTLIIGNPNLEAAKAWNYEINTSFYEGALGLLSVSAFYKDIKDMFHLIDELPFEGDGDQNYLDSLGINYENPFEGIDYILTYPYNSDKPTRVWGFETEVQSNLRFLPGFLKNFVLNGNFSIVRSETYIASVNIRVDSVMVPGIPFPIPVNSTELVETKQKLEGQPNFFGNLALGYDLGGFSGRISVFYQDEYNRTFSPNRRSDEVQNSFTRVDLSLRQHITRNLSIFVNINNLTNAKEGTSSVNRVENWRLLNEEQTFGVTADVGLRVQM